jgi:hypothetical protein
LNHGFIIYAFTTKIAQESIPNLFIIDIKSVTHCFKKMQADLHKEIDDAFRMAGKALRSFNRLSPLPTHWPSPNTKQKYLILKQAFLICVLHAGNPR